MIDINQPVTNPALAAAIRDMKQNNTQEAQVRVINEVMKAQFISPVIISPPPVPWADGKTVLEQNTTIHFTTLENAEKQVFYPAFTDWEELGKVGLSENQQTLVMTFEDLAALVLDEKGGSDGFVVNPFSDSLVLDKHTVGALAEEKRKHSGVVEQVIEEDTPVQLGQPRDYPTEMVKAISEYLKQQKRVNAAWLQLMMREGEQSYLIIVDFTGDKREIFDGIYKAAMDHAGGMPIDMIPYDLEFGRTATAGIEPFYKK